jgi:electron transport complex protein RnfG
MKEMVKYGTILGLICLSSSGILAVVNSVTAPKIAAQELQIEQAALQNVMPTGASFKPHRQGDTIAYYSAYDKNDVLTGFVIKSEKKGYSSSIVVMTGLNLKLEITAITVLSQNETPGLGSRILEPGFQEQFKGKTLDTFGEIHAITGATISSSAVIASVKTRIEALKDQLSQEINHAK